MVRQLAQSQFLTGPLVTGVYLLYFILHGGYPVTYTGHYHHTNLRQEWSPKKERDHPCPAANQHRCLTQTGQAGCRKWFSALPGGAGIFNRRTWGDTRCDNTSSSSYSTEYTIF